MERWRPSPACELYHHGCWLRRSSRPIQHETIWIRCRDRVALINFHCLSGFGVGPVPSACVRFLDPQDPAGRCDTLFSRRAWSRSVPLTIRKATPEELPNLSELCLRSKAVWGYDQAFMEACRRANLASGGVVLDEHRGCRRPGRGGWRRAAQGVRPRGGIGQTFHRTTPAEEWNR
jgi:hypothetical protein